MVPSLQQRAGWLKGPHFMWHLCKTTSNPCKELSFNLPRLWMCSARTTYKSVFGLPMLSCCTRGYRSWSMVILILDLTYSAFILPISVGFQARSLQGGKDHRVCRAMAGCPAQLSSFPLVLATLPPALCLSDQFADCMQVNDLEWTWACILDLAVGKA
jgi:hypothetical protein